MAGFENLVQGLQSAGFFAFAIPYLLVVAIVYGILEHVNLPKAKPVRATIAILSGFIILPLGNVIYPYISRMWLSLIVVSVAALVLVIMAESMGLKAADKKHIWEEHPKITGLVFIVIAVMVFSAAGGWDLIGLGRGGGFGFSASTGTVALLLTIALGVWWITKEKKDK